MKRPLLIILSVVVVFVLLGTAMISLFAPRVANTFSTISNELPGGYGGGGAPDVYLASPQEAPLLSSDAAAPLPAGDETRNLNITTAQQERKVIMDDQISLVVKDPETSMKEIIALAEEMGGYVVSSNLSQSSYGPNNIPVPQAEVVIRVPAEKLTNTADEIKKGAVKVQSENLTGQDVTEQYVDLQSRLAADQVAEAQLIKIMQSAEKTEDVLNVYQQLRQVQSDIEVLKGQIKYIDEFTSTSKITVTLIAEETVKPVEIGGWKLQGAANDAIQDLINFTQGFTRFLIRFVLFTLPVLVLIAIPLYLLFLGGRAVPRRFGWLKAKAEVKEEEKK